MLEALFRPKAVAIIGASTKELSIGNRIIRNLLDFGYKGSIYPINPKADEVRGVKSYATIFDVEEDIDLAHIIIPGKFVPQAVEDCGKKGIKAIIINSAGFRETGPEGEAIEKDFLARAQKYGIRIFGPNCQGIINTDPDLKAYCNFTFTKPEPGFISIVAQSGGVGELIHQGFSEMGVGTRIYASNGNAADVSITEVIEYLGEDEDTRVIVLYVEGLSDPAEFMDVAGRVVEKKPILAMKAGRTKEGAKAASSHTGGLATEDIATELIFKKLGILTFRDEGDLCNAAAAFASQPLPRGNRTGIITNTGGPAIIATDLLVDAGLEIPPLSSKAEDFLKSRLYEAASVNNPVDVLATGGGDHFRAAMDALMDEDEIDSLYINFVTPFFVDTQSIAEQIVEVNRMKKKPIVCNLMTDKRQWTETLNILKNGDVPIYPFPTTAAKALAALTEYSGIKKKEKGKVEYFEDVKTAVARDILEKAKSEGRQALNASESYGVFEAYNIPCARWRMANTPAEAARMAADIGFPVALKAESPAIVHKTDAGGVTVNLGNEAAVKSSAEYMEKNLKGTDGLQYLVQEYIPVGKEIIIGAKEEPGLGHLIMFGMGGVYVEVLKDVIFSIAPLTRIEAEDMIGSIQMAPLLTGIRGEKGIDRTKIAGILLRVSRLVTDLPEIKEMDLNPLIATEDGVLAVDARIAV